MIREFEQYHGVVLRDIVVCAGETVRIEARDEHGRVNSYLVNDSVGLYLKHSAKRLSPWQFTFHEEHLAEIERLEEEADHVCVALVCGPDGVVVVSADELREMNDSEGDTTWFVRVERSRGTMYHLNGSAGELSSAKPRGVAVVVSALRGEWED